ncbi:MAG: fold metallo-hydrolase [Thermoleophilia bacterium]|nr:fold metallo-hydrolase [Thermoleophilia bacterium]MCZ4496650.1 fold metallo-hydrolase [Thermoleophilia bacterium]
MIVERSMHPKFLSNSYLVADKAGGHAVIIDAGGPIEPFFAHVDQLELRVTHVLLTHDHHDHTIHAVELGERYGATVISADQSADGYHVQSGALELRTISTPGHCAPHVAWVAYDGETPVAVFTGDVLFHHTVGGTVNGGANGFAELRDSVTRLLELPPETIVFPGHTDQSTIGDEATDNPFVLAWRGDRPLLDEPVQVLGSTATLIFEGPDYDGGTKAWVKFDDGREAIVGGSIVER